MDIIDMIARPTQINTSTATKIRSKSIKSLKVIKTYP